MGMEKRERASGVVGRRLTADHAGWLVIAPACLGLLASVFLR